jgi:hypothetical protein
VPEANLVDADLRGADLTGCAVFGVAAWGLLLDGAKQDNLVITAPAPWHMRSKFQGLLPEDHFNGLLPVDHFTGFNGLLAPASGADVTVDNSEVAQFSVISKGPK